MSISIILYRTYQNTLSKSSRIPVFLVLTTYVGYRLVRHLLIHDPVGSAALSLIADFLFGSLVNWLLVWLVFYTIARDIDSPLTEPVWSHVTIAGIAVGYAIVWFRFYNPVGGFPSTVDALALSLLGTTLLSLSVFVLLTGSPLQSGVLTTACFMLGNITALVTSLSPIPELLVGGWILWVVVQSLGVTDRKRPGLVSVDFEERVGTAAMGALRSEKGLYALIVSLTGFLTALLPLFALVVMFYVDFGGETPPVGRTGNCMHSPRPTEVNCGHSKSARSPPPSWSMGRCT